MSASVERLRRDNVVDRPLDEPAAVSPTQMKQLYRQQGIPFGR